VEAAAWGGQGRSCSDAQGEHVTSDTTVIGPEGRAASSSSGSGRWHDWPSSGSRPWMYKEFPGVRALGGVARGPPAGPGGQANQGMRSLMAGSRTSDPRELHGDACGSTCSGRVLGFCSVHADRRGQSRSPRGALARTSPTRSHHRRGHRASAAPRSKARSAALLTRLRGRADIVEVINVKARNAVPSRDGSRSSRRPGRANKIKRGKPSQDRDTGARPAASCSRSTSASRACRQEDRFGS